MNRTIQLQHRKAIKMPALSKTLLSMAEVVSATGISEKQIRREMERGKLPSRLLCGRRRFLVSDVETFLGASLRLASN